MLHSRSGKTRLNQAAIRIAGAAAATLLSLGTLTPPAIAAEDVDPPSIEPSGSDVGVVIPEMPKRSGRAFAVDEETITEFARRYVDTGGDPHDIPRFYFGSLALESLEELCTQTDLDRVRALLGNLAVSGYFGGVWLRDIMAGPDSGAPEPSSALLTMASPAQLIMQAMDGAAAGLVRAAIEGGDFAVGRRNAEAVPLLLFLYGYNRGYLEVILEEPPLDAPAMLDRLVCDGFLDCDAPPSPDVPVDLDSALERIDDPKTPRWWEMSLWTRLLRNTPASGRRVWSGRLGDDPLSPAAYEALVDLSAMYLMVSKTAVLGAMTAYADHDPDVGRCALRLQAGLWLWSGSYFGGLVGDAAPGTLPDL